MNKLTIVFIVGALTLVAVPRVYADETKADCESGQPWIGYYDTEGARSSYNSIADTLGGVPRVNTCEGEQWDGGDQVSSNPTPGPNGAAECTPSVDAASSAKNVNLCMSDDLNEDTSQNTPTSTPLGVRVSTDGSQVYVGANIRLVGDVVVYQGVGTDGKTSTTAVYLRDNVNDIPTGLGNVLATAVHDAGLTQGWVDESDCTQSEYQQSADAKHNHQDASCGRDNTAATVEVLP